MMRPQLRFTTRVLQLRCSQVIKDLILFTTHDDITDPMLREGIPHPKRQMLLREQHILAFAIKCSSQLCTCQPDPNFIHLLHIPLRGQSSSRALSSSLHLPHPSHFVCLTLLSHSSSPSSKALSETPSSSPSSLLPHVPPPSLTLTVPPSPSPSLPHPNPHPSSPSSLTLALPPSLTLTLRPPTCLDACRCVALPFNAKIFSSEDLDHPSKRVKGPSAELHMMGCLAMRLCRHIIRESEPTKLFTLRFVNQLQNMMGYQMKAPTPPYSCKRQGGA